MSTLKLMNKPTCALLFLNNSRAVPSQLELILVLLYIQQLLYEQQENHIEILRQELFLQRDW